MNMFFDSIITSFGLYLIYQAIYMKKTGKVVEGLLVGKKTNMTRAKDIPGFVNFMFSKTLLLGVAGMLSGLCGISNDIVGGLEVLSAIASILLFATLIYFTVSDVKAQRRFLVGIVDEKKDKKKKK